MGCFKRANTFRSDNHLAFKGPERQVACGGWNTIHQHSTCAAMALATASPYPRQTQVVAKDINGATAGGGIAEVNIAIDIDFQNSPFIILCAAGRWPCTPVGPWLLVTGTMIKRGHGP